MQHAEAILRALGQRFLHASDQSRKHRRVIAKAAVFLISWLLEVFILQWPIIR